ncbi:hypothetical protein MTO96_041824 [Rhipicephalus appendiculatus]
MVHEMSAQVQGCLLHLHTAHSHLSESARAITEGLSDDSKYASFVNAEPPALKLKVLSSTNELAPSSRHCRGCSRPRQPRHVFPRKCEHDAISQGPRESAAEDAPVILLLFTGDKRCQASVLVLRPAISVVSPLFGHPHERRRYCKSYQR